MVRIVPATPVGPLQHPDARSTEVADGLVVDVDGEVVHHLDSVASIVFTLCDGRSLLGDVSAALSTALEMDSDEALHLTVIAVDRLIETGLVTDGPQFEALDRRRGIGRFRGRPGSIDHAVFDAVYLTNEYRIPAALPPGTAVLDVGAHIGSFAASMVDAGAAHVIAVEPAPANLQMVDMNLTREIRVGTVEVMEAAIGPGPDGQELIVGAAPNYTDVETVVNTGAHRTRPSAPVGALADDEYLVRSVSLDTLIDTAKRRSPDAGSLWLKLDCEGAEWDALDGAQRLAELDVVVAELHDVDTNVLRCDQLRQRLVSLGFDVEIVENPDSTELALMFARRLH